MSNNEQRERVVIAVTETSPIAELWATAMQAISSSNVELVVIFLHDERWHRAASLPFTREISHVGGDASDFTLQRAEQLLAEKAASLRQSIEERAKSAGLAVAFQVLAETDQVRTRTLVDRNDNIVIGPAVLAKHPVFLELKSVVKRMVLIEAGAESDSRRPEP
jgi:hypothetical protein